MQCWVDSGMTTTGYSDPWDLRMVGGEPGLSPAGGADSVAHCGACATCGAKGKFACKARVAGAAAGCGHLARLSTDAV